MQIYEVEAHGGRTFNHPVESYSNLRSDVILRARLTEDDNPAECIAELRRQAQAAADADKREQLAQITLVTRRDNAMRWVKSYAERIATGEGVLEDARKMLAKLEAEPVPADGKTVIPDAAFYKKQIEETEREIAAHKKRSDAWASRVAELALMDLNAFVGGGEAATADDPASDGDNCEDPPY